MGRLVDWREHIFLSKTNAVPKGRTGVKLGNCNRDNGLAYGVLVDHKSCPLQFSATPTLGFSSSSLSSPNLSLSFFLFSFLVPHISSSFHLLLLNSYESFRKLTNGLPVSVHYPPPLGTNQSVKNWCSLHPERMKKR